MRRPVRYDRDGDRHYDTISAFIKSVRGERSRRGAVLPRVMLEGGEDPRLHRAPDRDPRQRGHRQRRPARARAGRGVRARRGAGRPARVHATRSRRPRPTSHWRPSRTPPARRSARRAQAAQRPRDGTTAGRSARRQLPRRRRARQRRGLPLPARRPRRVRRARITCRAELAGSQLLRADRARARRPSSRERLRELRRARESERAQRMRWPSAEQISSTASSPVMFSRSRIGFTSTTSSEPTAPASGERAPSPGAPRGRRCRRARRCPRRAPRTDPSTSMSSETWTCAEPRTCSERAADDGLHAEPVDLGDREHAHARTAQALALARVERRGSRSATVRSSSTDGVGQRPAREPLAAPAERAAQPHAVHVAGRASSRACCSRRGRRTRSSATGTVDAREPAEDAERERVVAAEHERHLAGARSCDSTASAISSQTARIWRRGTSRGRRRRRAPRSDARSTVPRSCTAVAELARAGRQGPA